MRAFIYLIIFIDAGIFCVVKKYRNFTLYRVIPVNESHIDYFLKLDERYDINFWREPGVLYSPIDFVISPKHRLHFVNEARQLGLYYTPVIGDVQRAFDKQIEKTYLRYQENVMNWHTYCRLDVIYNWLENLSATYPEEVGHEIIGYSYQNRPIVAIKVALQGSSVRSTVIIEGGIHAREWISPAFVTYLINAIVNSRTSEDPTLKYVASMYEWYFVPVLNPDGYEYSHIYDRLWRKNCNGLGVDLNRNFAFWHGSVGISRIPRSESYCGSKAFSERESYAMSRLVQATNSTLEYYISFHSYGQHIIISYGNTVRHLDNYNEVLNMCKTVIKRIKSRYRTIYNAGTGFETVGYLVSGSSSCWVKKQFKVPYVVTFELRDRGFEGFTLSRSKIIPTCRETLDGLLSFLIPRKRKFTKLKNLAPGLLLRIEKEVIALIVILFIKIYFVYNVFYFCRLYALILDSAN